MLLIQIDGNMQKEVNIVTSVIYNNMIVYFAPKMTVLLNII